MNDQKSFVMYHDLCAVFSDMSDEDAGKLIKAITSFAKSISQGNQEKPTGLSGLLRAVFNPFEAHLQRDSDKWMRVRERNSINGKAGGRPKKNPVGFSGNPKNPEKAVNVNVNVNELKKIEIDKSISTKEKKEKNFDSKKGSRLSPDWQLSDEDGEWAEAQGMMCFDILHQEKVFRDYWVSKAGSAGVKLDWSATWRNWIRKHIELKQQKGL